MTLEQALILGILLLTVILFLLGRWRHDMVAGAALFLAVLLGLVEAGQAFTGFGHPAVITVACILILSRGLQTSGAVDVLARHLLPAQAGPTLSIMALTGVGCVLSGFMNNVGALALLMPVGLQISRRLDMAPGQVLMPLAFGSILGGMTTLIGTPPNLVVATFRQEATGTAFGMFDFSPVGVAVALLGLAFVVSLGWRLVPVRRQSGAESFDAGAYLTEARVPEDSKAAGERLREIEKALEKADAQVVGLVRNEVKVNAPHPGRRVLAGDILIIEADAEALATAISALGLILEESKTRQEAKAKEEQRLAREEEKQAKQEKKQQKQAEKAVAESSAKPPESQADEGRLQEADEDEEPHQRDEDHAKVVASSDDRDDGEVSQDSRQPDGEGEPEAQADDQQPDKQADKKVEKDGSEEIILAELAVMPGSILTGRSATGILLRTRYGINLVAISRQGQRAMARLRSLTFRAGDVLMMQGPAEAINEFASNFGCVPLAERELRIPEKRNAIVATGIMAVAIVVAAMGLLPAAVSFAGGVLASVLLRTIPQRAIYDAVDWPVIVLLAALIPVAGAMESSGAADLIARFVMETLARGDAMLALGLVLVITMFLSDLMNNAATAAVMCPIALGASNQLGVNPDAFLMAVAVGASCAFLTPIGHQNNTLILGPGGFKFGDYWRLGLPLEVVVVAVSMPMLLWIWPL